MKKIIPVIALPLALLLAAPVRADTIVLRVTLDGPGSLSLDVKSTAGDETEIDYEITGSVDAQLSVTNDGTTTPEQRLSANEGPFIITSGWVVNLREKPSTNAFIAQRLEASSVLPIIGISTDGLWYKVQLANSTTGWVFAGVVEAHGSSENLEVINE